MFEEVAQMEKEIEKFRKNMMASSELVEGISQLKDATQRQKEAFSASSRELIKKIDSCILQIKSDHEENLFKLRENNDTIIADLQQEMAKEQSHRIAELFQIKEALENLQMFYAERLEQAKDEIDQYQVRLDESVEQIKTDHASALKNWSDRFDSTFNDLQDKTAADWKARVSEIEAIKSSIEEVYSKSKIGTDRQIQQLEKECQSLIAAIKTEVSEQQFTLNEKLQRTEQVIFGCQNEVVEYQTKLDELVERIQTNYVCLLKNWSERLDSAIGDLHKKAVEDLQAKVCEIDKIKSSIEEIHSKSKVNTDEQIQQFAKECQNLIAVMKTEISEQQAVYAEKLRQTEQMICDYQNEMVEYQTKLGEFTVQIQADHASLLTDWIEHLDSAIVDLQNKTAADWQVRVSEIDAIKSSIGEVYYKSKIDTDKQIQQFEKECQSLMAGIKTDISEQQSVFAGNLKKTEKVINAYQTEAEQKYKKFVQKMEATNVDQVFKEVQNLKKSVQTKFTVLMCGIGAAIIVSIIGLILK